MRRQKQGRLALAGGLPTHQWCAWSPGLSQPQQDTRDSNWLTVHSTKVIFTSCRGYSAKASKTKQILTICQSRKWHGV